MPVKKLMHKATEADRGKRLDQLLGDWLPVALGQPVSKAKARKLIVAGAVYLNGKRVRIASKILLPGARIEAFVDPAKLFDSHGPAQDKPFVMTSGQILFEDEFVIAVNKPAGLPTQPTLDEARINLFAAVKKFLAERDSPQAYVGLHHRLDRDTSGIVLFTKKKEANAGVSDLFSKHKAQKTYWALAKVPVRLLAERWSVDNYLGKAKGGGKKSKMTAVRSGGDHAHTDFHVVEKLSGALWIEALPRTGRMHQIRVHLSEGGMPILGDATYGDQSGKTSAPRLMLHAAKLEFPHPITGQSVVIECPAPEDFQKCLKQLRS